MERKLSIREHRRSKVRGARRKCSGMIEAIREATLVFPEEHAPGWQYWHMHLPVDQAFIDSQKTPHWVRRQCMQCLIDGAERLKGLKPKSDDTIRVVASISLPQLWDSEIIVYFSQEYFDKVFSFEPEWRTWTPLRESRSVSKERCLTIPEGFQERGYHLRVRDEELPYDGDRWFIGELE